MMTLKKRLITVSKKEHFQCHQHMAHTLTQSTLIRISKQKFFHDLDIRFQILKAVERNQHKLYAEANLPQQWYSYKN